MSGVGSDQTRIRRPGGEEPKGDEPCLVFVAGEAVLGLRVPLGGEVVIGRDAACAVRLPADDVSRRHARVIPDVAGGHLVEDLGSTNGTFVNGARVERRHLAGGDRLDLGPYAARYVAGGDGAARELERLAALALRDPLTGLANRRAFEDALARELARASAAGVPLAVVALDIDHFKRVNDAHGHAAGDAVLAAVAARGAAALRAGDLLARVGGEEFAALLPGASLAQARDVAERIRARIAEAPIGAGGAALEITASLGCAALAPDDADEGPLLARADARLYEAKRAGRNRVSA
jgi:two-component system, cell cycle response regulator